MTLRVRSALGAGLAFAALAAAPELRAQTRFSLELLDAGKPVPNAEVLFLLDEGKVALGVTATDGTLQVDMDLVDVGKGQEVVVYEIECDDQIVVVFVRPADVARFDEECELRRRENPECECRRIGAFRWGDDVVIDIGTRTVVRRPTETGPSGPTDGLVVGVGADVRQMTKLEDVVGRADGVIEADATTWAPGFQFMLEYMVLGMVAVGIEFARSTMETEARFAQGTQTGDLTYTEVGGTVRVGPWVIGRVRPYGVLGIFRTENDAEWRFDAARQSDTHTTERVGLGAGLDWWIRQRAALRMEGMYNTTFEDGDADEHVRWKLGLLFRPFAPATF